MVPNNLHNTLYFVIIFPVFAEEMERNEYIMLTSREITKKWEAITETKCALKAGRCFLLAVLAGVFIGLGAMGATVIQSLAQAGLGKLLGASVFPTGLMLVVMAGGELFTGNCLMAGPALIGKAKWPGILRNWGIAYLGNMLGAFLVAILATAGGVLQSHGQATADLALTIAANKSNLSFMDALLKGIGCNILVCGAVFMATGAQSGGSKAVCCFFPIMLFVLCGLEHSIANMYYVPAGLLMQEMPRYAVADPQVTVSAYLLHNLLPVTLGNILGGAGLAAAYAGIHRDV